RVAHELLRVMAGSYTEIRRRLLPFDEQRASSCALVVDPRAESDSTGCRGQGWANPRLQNQSSAAMAVYVAVRQLLRWSCCLLSVSAARCLRMRVAPPTANSSESRWAMLLSSVPAREVYRFARPSSVKCSWTRAVRTGNQWVGGATENRMATPGGVLSVRECAFEEGIWKTAASSQVSSSMSSKYGCSPTCSAFVG
ncbi:hypothetical protein ACFZBU_43425, partial [Embleya sp. NPDC008237]|uniref:hypothetical protein n=1 Tax=Embleya sp. NPDC008237 TaxID=3363978 RepID=UPI0036E2BC68